MNGWLSALYAAVGLIGTLCMQSGDDPKIVVVPCRDPMTMGLGFSPDGRTLATGGRRESSPVRLWDASTGIERVAFEGARASIYRVVYSPDGELIAIGGTDPGVLLWTKEGKLLATLPHPAPVPGLAFSPDGHSIATGCTRDGGVIRIWDVETHKLRQELKGHARGVGDLAFSPDGRLLASAGLDATVRVWDVHDGKVVHLLDQFADWVGGVEFTPDGRILAVSSSRDREVRLYDVATVTIQHTIPIKSNGCLAFSPDGKSLYVDNVDDSSIRVFDVGSGKEQAKYPSGLGGRIFAIAVSADGKLVAWGGEADARGSCRILHLGARAEK